MSFQDFSPETQLSLVKIEFNKLIKRIFEDPPALLPYAEKTGLTKKQTKEIFRHINALNSKTCACCRAFDPSKLKLPIPKELEPLIDITQTILNSKQF